MAVRSLGLPWGIVASDAYADGTANANDVVDLQRASRPASERFHLEAVYRARRPEMIRYLVSFGVELGEAEDITQEIFLNCFGNVHKSQNPDNLFRWALVCAKNLAINRHRRQRREVLAPARAWKKWEETLPDSHPDAELRLQEEQRYRNLTEWISTLSDVEQECAVLRCQGVSFREMAVSLDLPVRKVIYITSVAIQKLKRERERQAR